MRRSLLDSPQKIVPWVTCVLGLVLVIYLMMPRLGGGPDEFRNRRYVRSLAMRVSGAFERSKFEKDGQAYLDELVKHEFASGMSYDINDLPIHVSVKGDKLSAWSNGPNKINEDMRGDDVVEVRKLYE